MRRMELVGAPQPGLLFTSRCTYQLRKPKDEGGTEKAVSGKAGNPQPGTVSVFETSIRWDADGGACSDLPVAASLTAKVDGSLKLKMVIADNFISHVFEFTEKKTRPWTA